MDDDLLKTRDSLVTAVAREGLTPFLGAYPSGDVVELFWNCALERDPSAFVQVAKSSGAKVVYLSWIVFSDDDIEEAMAGRVEEGAIENDEDERTRERDETVRGFRKYVGAVASVRAGFFLDSVFHVFDQETTWYEEFGDLIGDGESAEVPGRDREPERELGAEDLAWAEKLARHEAFGKAKDWRQRMYLLRRLAGQQVELDRGQEIIAHAEAVYEIDVKPAEEAQLAETVRKLREEGLSIVAIAGRLDLPRERVQRLLAKLGD